MPVSRRPARDGGGVQALAETLRGLLLVVYPALAGLALWQYRRRRIRPAAFLAAAFACLAGALILGRVGSLVSEAAAEVTGGLALVGLLVFPWLLAAFAWSFEGRLPRWLRAAWLPVGIVTAVYALTRLDASPVGRGVEPLFLGLFLVAWLVPSLLGAARLLRAGGSSSRVVRARMRLIAGSLLLLSVALVVLVATPPGGPPVVRVVVYLLALLSAGFAHAGFAPPLPLRLWWRRRGTGNFQQMQQQLIVAVTPVDAARAVAPILAGHVGAATLVLGRDGEVLAAAEFAHDDIAAVRSALAAGDAMPTTEVLRLRHATLVVRMTSYSPFFGDYEHELVAAYGWQLQLAMERSELAAKHLDARAEAERARHELEATLLGLSHDLRSPAVAVHGYATLLRDAADEAERAQLLDGISASAEYLNGLVDALLELSRVGRTQTGTEPVDLGAVARTVRERVAITCPRATIEVATALPVVEINPVRAEQLIDNLVSNAVKHGGREDLTVRVSARRTDTTIELRVADDGGGIRPDDRERIFELFQRGRNAVAAGTGVGLGMVRRIAEHHGGEVRLAETDTGATFVVSLPASLLVPASPAAVERDTA